MTSKQLAQKVAGFADDKKAQDIVLLDMRGLVNFCDYFVIATGTSNRQVKAVVQSIDEEVTKLGIRVYYDKGSKNASTDPSGDIPEGMWALLDMGDVVVHVFEPQAREFYGLEHLWQDAPQVGYKSKSKK